jgi:hypothetical protein
MYITYMLNGHPVPCFQMFRMEPPDFIALCFELRECQFITSTRNLDVEESVVIFSFAYWALPRAADRCRSLSTLHEDNKPALS